MIPQIAVALALSMVVALAGCVNDSNDGHIAGDGHHDDDGHHGGANENSGNLPYSGSEDVIFNVRAGEPSEFRFSPDKLEALAGQSVGIVFTNNGGAAHEFSIEAVEFHLHVQPGESLQASFIAPEAGDYVIGCYIPGHFEAGMKGTLVIS